MFRDIRREIIRDLAWKYVKEESMVPSNRTGTRTRTGTYKYQTGPSQSAQKYTTTPADDISKVSDEIHEYMKRPIPSDIPLDKRRQIMRGWMMAENAVIMHDTLKGDPTIQHPEILTTRDNTGLRGVASVSMTTLLHEYGDTRPTMMIHFIGALGTGQGVGTDLLRSALAWGKQHGAIRCILDSRPDAAEFYLKNGFKDDPETGGMVYEYQH